MSRLRAIVVDAVRHALPLVPFYFYPWECFGLSAPGGIRPGARAHVNRGDDARYKGPDHGRSARGLVDLPHHGRAGPGGVSGRGGGIPDYPVGNTGLYIGDAGASGLDRTNVASGLLLAGRADGAISRSAGATPVRGDD